jgi:hypothetical protein
MALLLTSLKECKLKLIRDPSLNPDISDNSRTGLNRSD